MLSQPSYVLIFLRTAIKVRQTITKDNDREFHALWEKMGEDRNWSALSDERCTRLISASQGFTFQLPAPTGQYQVGTITYHWVDNSRRETYRAEIYDLQTQSLATTSRSTDHRELLVYVWYPARVEQETTTASYIDEGFAIVLHG